MLLDRYATYTGLRPAPRARRAGVGAVRRADLRRLARRGRAARSSADALHARCVERGVTFRFGADVAAVVVDGGRVAASGWPTASRSPADVVVSDADAAHLYADLLPRRSAARRCAPAATARRRRCPASSLLLALRGRTPGAARTTPCCSPPTTTPSSTRCSAGAPRPVARPGRLRLRARRPGACAPTTTTRRGSCWSTRRGTHRRPRPRRRLGRAAAWPTATPTGCSTCWRARGLDVRDRLLWREIRTPADLERDTGSPGGSIYGTSSQRRRGRRSCARPTRRRCPGCSSSAARRTPAAGCRWSGMSAEIVAGLVGPA